MKYIYIAILLSISLSASEVKQTQAKYVSSIVEPKMSVKAKKKRFYALLLPAVQKVYEELQEQFRNISKDIEHGTNVKEIERLKKVYKVTTDEELLMALKPHPKSIALAQAAIESSWATSRFFTEANNTFGIWSYNKDEPRIAANEKRGGTYTVWLRKYATVEESVRAYYKTMGRSRSYKEFRKVRYESDDVFEIIKKLDRYSERKEKYTQELAAIIRYNKLTKYD